ncbi:hypothetical protein [Roseomonas sp. USHLN139]
MKILFSPRHARHAPTRLVRQEGGHAIGNLGRCLAEFLAGSEGGA